MSITDLHPEVIVGALILDEGDRLFLISSPKFGGRFVPPGGHVEFGESLDDALRRELLEETGFSVENIEFLSVDECIEERRHLVFLNYTCRRSSGLPELNEEAIDGRFFTLEEALELPLADSCRRMLTCFDGRRESRKRVNRTTHENT